MKNVIVGVLFVAVFVCLSYTSASAQVVDKIKDAAGKTKDVTVDTAKKTGVVVTDGLDKAADKTKEGTKKGASATKKFGSHAVTTTENVAGETYERGKEAGKYATVKTWDGTKWVSKRVWYASKKTSGTVKDAVVGDGDQKP